MGFKITFLGTGGGRHTTMYQSRSTGGMLMEHAGGIIHADPGPSALVQMRKIHYDPARTSSVIVSHAHPDHYSDAECVIEGMTYGGWKKRGCLYGSRTVIEGVDGLGPCLSKYHMDIVSGTHIFKPGDVLDIDGLRTDVCRAEHSDPTNVGFKFNTDAGIVSYVSDTSFSPEIAEQYKGTRVLILPVTTPWDLRIHYHLCTEDAAKFASIVKPELTVMIHFGIVIIRRGPKNEAALIEKHTGLRAVAAHDLMTLDVGDDLVFGDAETYDDGEWIPPSSV
ncbi:MAG: MBL fold metallo-hydrolase [Candidatus Methanoplasma sp.]|jgi:phosphoribosyl 1,2-cyclic phosphodiesterase|nr:MBL fold metallo-hydrolase [Candidatus Methanoplasma sp.]